MFGDLPSPTPATQPSVAAVSSSRVKQTPDLFGNDDLFDDLPPVDVKRQTTKKQPVVAMEDDLFGEGTKVLPVKKPQTSASDDLFGDLDTKPTSKESESKPPASKPLPLSDDLFVVKETIPTTSNKIITKDEDEDLFASLGTVPKQTKKQKPVKPVIEEDPFDEETKPTVSESSKVDSIFSDAPDLSVTSSSTAGMKEEDDLFASVPSGKKPPETTVRVLK